MINVFMGKSSSGKSAISKKLKENYGFEELISHTTRPIREGEVDGRDYIYISQEKFAEMIRQNEFIEYRKYNTLTDGEKTVWYYGLGKRDFDYNKDYVIVLDVQGAKDFIDYAGIENCNLILIETHERLREKWARQRGGFDKDEWNRRKLDDDKVFSYEGLVSVLGDYWEYATEISNVFEGDLDGLVEEVVYELR